MEWPSSWAWVETQLGLMGHDPKARGFIHHLVTACENGHSQCRATRSRKSTPRLEESNPECLCLDRLGAGSYGLSDSRRLSYRSMHVQPRPSPHGAPAQLCDRQMSRRPRFESCLLGDALPESRSAESPHPCSSKVSYVT